GPKGPPAVRNLALSLTGCAAVAVLGARRPGVVAWNLVVAALLAVMLLPVAASVVTGREMQPGHRMLLLACAVGAGVLNYLPTRLGPAAVALAAASACEILPYIFPGSSDRGFPAADIGPWMLSAVPW